MRDGPVVGLLSDFGTRDWYVGVLKAILLRGCPDARIVDITHEIPPHDIAAGAFVLHAAAPWFPARSVLLAVVDPGVGSDRRLLAMDVDGRRFVGPDNGVLALVASQAKRRAIVELTNRRRWLQPVSSTFHGRDILAPVAARLASGARLTSVGETVDAWRPLAFAEPMQRAGLSTGAIIHIDRFGNLITNLPATLLERGRAARVRCGKRRARVVSSYSEGRVRELVALTGSHGYVELAVRDGSAARQIRAARGDVVSARIGASRAHRC